MNGKAAERPIPELPEDVLRLCYDEAAQCYPEEACGLIIGPRDDPRCDEVRPCKNEQNLRHAMDPEAYPRDGSTAFTLPDRDLLYLARTLGSARPVRVIFHSHVEVGAYFSAEDRRVALIDGEPCYPEVDHLVIDCAAAGVRGARLFRFRDGDFVEIAAYPGSP